MAQDDVIRQIIQARTYGRKPTLWTGMPSRVRTGGAGPSFTSTPTAMPTPVAPAPAVGPIPSSTTGAAMNIGRTGPVAMPRAIPATTGMGMGTGRPIPMGPAGMPGGASTMPNPGYAGPVPAGSQIAPLPAGAAAAPGASPAAAAAGGGRLAGLGRSLGGVARALPGLATPIAAGATLGAMSAGMGNEGNHPYTNIPVVGGLADTSGDSISDQFREGMMFGGPQMGVLNIGLGALQSSGVGGFIGGVFGGGGGDSSDSEEVEKTPRGRVLDSFNAAASNGMLDPTLRGQYLAYYDMLLSTAGDDSDESKAAAAQAAQTKIMEDASLNLGVAGQQQLPGPNPMDILAQQAQVAAIVQPYTDAMSQNAAARNQLLQGMVGELPAEFQGVMGAASAGQGLAQQQLIQALGAQAAMVPHTLTFEAMQQQQAGIASQLQQQAIQGLMNPQTAAPAAGMSLDDLLAQQPTG